MINNLTEAITHAKEKAKELSDKAYAEYGKTMTEEQAYECNECAREHEQLAGWLEELAERRKADRWIPVSERLPEKEGRCLVFTDYGDVTMDSFVAGMFVCYLGNVTHWRPLPQKPYESEEK